MSRFERAGQVTSYLGLVPQEYSSGERQRRGRILRSAHPQVQSLLVQAAWRVWRVADPRTAQFRSWAQAIARRRGKKVAMVALARRLARTLFAMWRDQTDYQPERIRARRPTLGTEVTLREIFLVWVGRAALGFEAIRQLRPVMMENMENEESARENSACP